MPFSCSLLIPCRNAARFLPTLLAGVQAQQTPFDEILFWDDGSTDDSAKIAAAYGARVLRSAVSVGPATARNELVKAARNEWVHLHDADDLIDPAYLATLGPEAKPGVDVIVCDADWIDEATRQCVIRWRYSQQEYQAAPAAYLLTHPLGINNCIYRRDAFLAQGGYRPDLVPWEDTDFHIRLAFAGCHFTFVPAVLTQSVRHAAGISMDYRKNWSARLRCLETYAALMPNWLHPILAAEAERAASELAVLGDAKAADAVTLCRRLGGDPPSSRNIFIRLLKPFLPAPQLLRLQRRNRAAAQSAGG